MTSRLTIDKAGRIVLPKPVRDDLRLKAGDSLELESTTEEIVLRPVTGKGQLRKKQGVWVFHSDEPLTPEMVRKTIRDVRRERERQIWGGE